MTTGAIDVFMDLRTWWSNRGVDYWTEDPTSRTGDGWVRLSDLADDPDWLRAIVDGVGERLSVSDRKAAAALLAKGLISMIAFPPTVAWMQWRRVPAVLPDETWLQFVEGRAVRLAHDRLRAWVTEDDQLAGAPDCEVVDRSELRELLAASAYDGAMGAVIDAIHEVERTGRRHLWGNLSLAAVNSALWSGDATDPWADGVGLLRSRTTLSRTLEAVPAERPDTGPFVIALRKTCCLAYKVEDHGYCASCSLLDRDERITKMTESIGNAWRDRPRT